MDSVNELFDKVLENTTDEIYVQNPCKVVAVNGNFVDVLLYINDDEPDIVIYNVPIKRPETQRAYIFLGIKEGDRGVCRFFDRSVESYMQSDFDFNSDDRQHDINDRCFELGFIPNEEAFVYPTDKEIEIGLKNAKFKLSVNEEGSLDIITESDITMTISGNLTANVTGNANIQATEIKSDGILTHTGNVNITGTVAIDGSLSATQLTDNTATSGTFATSVTVAGGIVRNGIP